jgi:hypothetical protein
VPGARTLTAGVGLSGGGDLTANRTFDVDYGNVAGTAVEGDDVRLTTAPTRTVAGASVTPAASDAAGMILFSSGSAVTVTMPSAVFTAGQSVVLRPTGAGQITVVAGAGATMRSPNGAKSAGQWRAIVCTYLSGSEFVVEGDCTT